LRCALEIVATLEDNRRYVSRNPHCEPQLGRRGLYRAVGGNLDREAVEMGLLWVLNLADGEHDLLAIAQRSGLSFDAVRTAADALVAHDLLEPAGAP
jgi:aminopeptidase-like protein